MRSEEVDVGGMSDADHLVHAQSLQLHHNLHPHSLNHGLGHAQHGMHEMHVHGHGEADGQARVDQRVLEGDHVHGHHGHHGHGMHNSEENGAGEEHDDDAGDEEGLDEAEMHSDGGGNPGDQPAALAVRTQGSTQLTLSYQGEVYVFDAVPPEKVNHLALTLIYIAYVQLKFMLCIFAPSKIFLYMGTQCRLMR